MKPFRPNKPRKPGTTKAVVSALFAEVGGTDAVGLIIGLSATRTRACADPAEPDELSFERVRRLTLASGAHAAAQDLAALAGGVFVPGEAEAEAYELLLAKAEREHGQFVADVLAGKAAKDKAKQFADLRALITCLVAAAAKLADGGSA